MTRSVMRWHGCCLCRFGSKTTGLQLLSHNPVSHPSSVGTVKCDVYQAEATGIGHALTPYRPAQCSLPTLRCAARLACPGAHPIGRHDRGGSLLMTGTASSPW